jgi:hypothetical protein
LIRKGNLYYQQAVYNFGLTKSSAAVVQTGPEYCPSGGGVCTSYDDLVKDCQREQKWKAAISIIGATIKLAAAVIDPFAVGAGVGGEKGIKQLEKLGKGINAVGETVTTSVELAGEFTDVAGIGKWNPETTLPTLELNPTSPGQIDYEQASALWYLSFEKNLTKTLVDLSPAFWDSIYLENAKTINPVLLSPPSCAKYQDQIITALSVYLANVKNFTNYGNSMTSAEMSLAPASTIGALLFKKILVVFVLLTLTCISLHI